MPTRKLPLIQVAGVKNSNEAALLMECGVEYIGFPLRLNVHAEDTTEAEAARIIRTVGLPHRAVLITYLEKAAEIIEFMEWLGVTAVQIHGAIEPAELKKLKLKNPKYFVIKSLVVNGENERALGATVKETADFVDTFITDTFDPRTGASGATGLTHDWAISQRLVEASSKPIILAGGLNAANVAEAIRFVKPAGVDVHTGVEDLHGNKDPLLVKRFVLQAQAAFRDLLNA